MWPVPQHSWRQRVKLLCHILTHCLSTGSAFFLRGLDFDYSGRHESENNFTLFSHWTQTRHRRNLSLLREKIKQEKKKKAACREKENVGVNTFLIWWYLALAAVFTDCIWQHVGWLMASYHDPPDHPPAQNWTLWAAPPLTWTDWWASSSPRLTDSLCDWSHDRFHSPGCWSSPGKPRQVCAFVILLPYSGLYKWKWT